jgi:hypothetical protein
VLIIALLYFVGFVGIANLPHTSSKASIIMPANHHHPGAHDDAWNPRIVIPASSLSENTPVMLAKAPIQPIFLDFRLRALAST